MSWSLAIIGEGKKYIFGGIRLYHDIRQSNSIPSDHTVKFLDHTTLGTTFVVNDD
jgi:hypothetical protein